jgi:hypothetical protein
MATNLPIIRGTSAALYPFTQTFTAQTGKSDGENGAATRWVKGLPLVRIELATNRISQAAKDTLKAFLVSAKGQFAQNLQVTTYQAWNNLAFDQDEFVASETKTTKYDTKWTLTQTLPQNFAPGAPVAAYPVFGNGAISKLPYTQKVRFQTVRNVMPSGPQYASAEFAGTFSNFPTTGLMGWEFDEHNLTDAEVNTKLAHFLTNWGDCLPFTFTDEDAVTYSNVYYASPAFVITWEQFNAASIKTVLIQMF